MNIFMATYAVLAVSVLVAAPAGAAESGLPMVATTPVFSQIVTYTLPHGFEPAFSNASDRFYIQEAVRTGETVDEWSEMITMTGTKDAANSADPLIAAAESTRLRYQQACPDTLSAQSFGPSSIDGREALTVFLGCGTVQTAQGKISETAVIIFIKGQADVYTLQWAEHAAAQDSPPVYTIETWSPRITQLTPIKVCDRIAGEEAPYPSCIARK